MASQLIDSATFTFITFYGLVTINIIIIMIVGMWLFNVLIAALDTLYIYIGAALIKKYSILLKPTVKTRVVPFK